MTIQGVGLDCVELERFQQALDRQGVAFVEKTLTQNEIQYCQSFNHPLSHYAARFAAKEAIVKALGTGFRNGLSFLDIEIVNDEHGKPECRFLNEWEKTFKNTHILISITHTDHLAMCVAIWQ